MIAIGDRQHLEFTAHHCLVQSRWKCYEENIFYLKSIHFHNSWERHQVKPIPFCRYGKWVPSVLWQWGWRENPETSIPLPLPVRPSTPDDIPFSRVIMNSRSESCHLKKEIILKTETLKLWSQSFEFPSCFKHWKAETLTILKEKQRSMAGVKPTVTDLSFRRLSHHCRIWNLQ